MKAIKWIVIVVLLAICSAALNLAIYHQFRVEAQDKPPAAAPEPPLALQAEPVKPETPAPGASKTFEPTEVELLRLQLLEKDAELAQIALSQASANWQKATSDFNAQIEAIKKAHGWPADVRLDAQTYAKTKGLKFVETPIPPE